MIAALRHLHAANLRGLAVALVATLLSAGLAFAASPPDGTPGLAKAAVHAGKTVPVQATDEDEATEEDEDTETEDEDTDAEEESADDTGDNCSTDPTALSDEDLAAMRHGSIVCWAAHQDSWPEEFKNHGQWVKSWATWKAPEGETSATTQSHGNGNGKANGHANKP